MTKRVLRVGGVDEPFNLPWLLACDADAFAELGVEVSYANYAGGTGALVAALFTALALRRRRGER